MFEIIIFTYIGNLSRELVNVYCETGKQFLTGEERISVNCLTDLVLAQ